MSNTFMTISGIELRLKPVSDMLKGRVLSAAKTAFELEHGAIEPPTYETSVGEIFHHDANSIAMENFATDEDRKAWRRFQVLTRKLQAHLIEVAQDFYLCRGVDAAPENDDWESEQFGIKIPTDPHKKKVHWLETEVLVSEDEKYKLAVAIRQLADPVEEIAAQVADTFQHSMEKGGRPTLD